MLFTNISYQIATDDCPVSKILCVCNGASMSIPEGRPGYDECKAACDAGETEAEVDD